MQSSLFSFVLVVEMITGQPLHSMSSSRDLAQQRGLPELRRPNWWGPDPPKAPTLHVRLLRVTF